MTMPDRLHARLEALLGSACVSTEEDQTWAYAIGPCAPTVVVRPETQEQAVAVLTMAGHERFAVVPWGQGTQMHLGALPQPYDLALCLAGLQRIVEYDVANLTVIAEAGLPLREVYRASLPERQFLPLGFPGTPASLGGLLVTNTSGIKRSRYGSLRDLLLGVRVALPDGSLTRFGGRVVKNVAGYDMNKLFIGSLGAFGVVLETSYRLAALPEDDRVLAMQFPTLTQAIAAAAAVQASQLLPSALMLLSAGAAHVTPLALTIQPDQVVLLLNFDGPHEAVQRQLRDSRVFCQQHGCLDETLVTGKALLTLWEAQEKWQAAPQAAEPARLQVRLGTLPSHLVDAIGVLTTLLPACLQQDVSWCADYMQGQIFAHIRLAQPESEKVESAVSAWLAQLRTQLRQWYGYGVVAYAPATLRQQLDVWGETPGGALLRLYKQRFDPHGVLNPGRYVAKL
jgi:glycolate oxidase FAD binding subunit